jgi:hypothetical protein
MVFINLESDFFSIFTFGENMVPDSIENVATCFEGISATVNCGPVAWNDRTLILVGDAPGGYGLSVFRSNSEVPHQFTRIADFTPNYFGSVSTGGVWPSMGVLSSQGRFLTLFRYDENFLPFVEIHRITDSGIEHFTTIAGDLPISLRSVEIDEFRHPIRALDLVGMDSNYSLVLERWRM